MYEKIGLFAIIDDYISLALAWKYRFGFLDSQLAVEIREFDELIEQPGPSLRTILMCSTHVAKGLSIVTEMRLKSGKLSKRRYGKLKC